MMLLPFLVLIGFQLLGEVLSRSFQLPLPGPVIGMFLLAAALVFKRRDAAGTYTATPPPLAQTAHSLIAHMGLLFVPAGVGIMTETDLLSHNLAPIVAGVIGSTLLSLIVTALVFHHNAGAVAGNEDRTK